MHCTDLCPTLLIFHFTRFGMSVNDDSVLRSVYYKYVHPKEVFIAEGILVPDVARKKNTVTLGGVRRNSANKINIKSSQVEKLPFVYPYGASLDVQVRTVQYYHEYRLSCRTYL